MGATFGVAHPDARRRRAGLNRVFAAILSGRVQSDRRSSTPFDLVNIRADTPASQSLAALAAQPQVVLPKFPVTIDRRDGPHPGSLWALARWPRQQIEWWRIYV